MKSKKKIKKILLKNLRKKNRKNLDFNKNKMD